MVWGIRSEASTCANIKALAMMNINITVVLAASKITFLVSLPPKAGKKPFAIINKFLPQIPRPLVTNDNILTGLIVWPRNNKYKTIKIIETMRDHFNLPEKVTLSTSANAKKDNIKQTIRKVIE